MRHADSWVWNHVNDQEKCYQILCDFTNSWRFVEAHLAGYCRRKMLLELFGESEPPTYDTSCCNVCNMDNGKPMQRFIEILVDTLRQKGEVNVAE